MLEPKAFHRPAHEALYRLILDLDAGGTTPDPITVLDEIEKRGVAEQVGGIAYVVALPQACASVENVGTYAVRVADYARERRFLLALRAAEERTQGGAPLGDVLVEVQDALRRLEGDATAAGEARARARVEGLLRQRVGTFLEPALARMRARALDQERPIALPWPSMNAALAGGFWPGLHVLVGNTGTGKSQWALQGALHAARNGVPVLYIGLELGELDLVARLVGLVTRRKWSRLFLGRDGTGTPNVEELNTVGDTYAEQLGELARIPFHLEVCPPMGWSYGTLYEKAKAMRAAYPEAIGADGQPRRGSRPFLVVLDFLQLVASPEGREREDLRERIGRAAYAGRAVARDLDAAVVLVSSTSRENYGALDGVAGKEKEKITPGSTPVHRLVGLGKESGEVEYAADSVLVFLRESNPDNMGTNDGFTPMHLAIAKARARSENAGNGWVPLRFNGGWFEEPRAIERSVLG